MASNRRSLPITRFFRISAAAGAEPRDAEARAETYQAQHFPAAVCRVAAAGLRTGASNLILRSQV
jgi:hypothetical protein